jgi:hypothetical protein
MDILEATTQYETWLAGQMPLVKADLDAKHTGMKASAFAFLRATFYRWAQRFPELLPDLAAAPQTMAVGDLHFANFGSWRDAEGRLAWGVNDFDEAASMPYPTDLARLAASVLLLIKEGELKAESGAACDAILKGYAKSLTDGGVPFVLAESHPYLRSLTEAGMKDPAAFWEKLEKAKTVDPDLLAMDVRLILEGALPQAKLTYQLYQRQAGMGSLGRRRYLMIAEWKGGKLAREVKRLAPSAWNWYKPAADDLIYYPTILTRAVRSADPLLMPRGKWVLRRLAPDCARLEPAQITDEALALKVLESMGRETGNVHVGTRDAVANIRAHFNVQPDGWLLKAAEVMAADTHVDWKVWKEQP